MPDPDRAAPLFDQSGSTIEGDVYNANELTVQLDGKTPVTINAANLHLRSRYASPRRTQQEELIKRHNLFGGRDDEIAKLDGLITGSAHHFHFVHAPSGFGKTALLANWVLQLRQRRQPVCFQFINRFESMADEEFALRNLCEQLAVLHGIVEELPAAVADLRSAYVNLVKLPLPEGFLVIVLDGLDEAKGWTPGSSLFPKSIPENTHIVFSARAESDGETSEWISQLGLNSGNVDILRLRALTETAVAKLLGAAGGKAIPLAEEPGVVRRLTEVSKGDPFYLHFLVKDIAEGVIKPEAISEQPRELQSYLDLWKKQLLDDVEVAKDEVYAILGLLSVALGPLKPVEFSGASSVLKKGLLLEKELTGPMRRYLSGSRQSGYALGHPRFRDYLAQHVFQPDELIEHRRQLLDFCRRWRENRSEYALNNFASHLADLDLRAELYALISREWKDARTRQLLSPRGLVVDLELAIKEAMAPTPAETVPFVRCALAYATVVSIVERLPGDVLGALTRLDGYQAAIDYASLLRDPQRRAGAYAAVAAMLDPVKQPDEIIELLKLGLSSAERIGDMKLRVGAVVRVGESSQRLAEKQLVQRVGEVLEAAAMDSKDAAVLEQIAAFFETAGQKDTATEVRERIETAKDVERASGWNFNFKIDWNPAGMPAYSAAEQVKSASELIEKGLVDEALTILLAEKDKLESASSSPQPDSYMGHEWLNLAGAFVNARETEQAGDCGNRALKAALESPGTYFDSRCSRLVGLAKALGDFGFRDMAHRAAAAAPENFHPINVLGGWNTLAPLPGILIDLGFSNEGKDAVSKLITTIESSEARQSENVCMVALAAAASLDEKFAEAKNVLTRSTYNWQQIPQYWWPDYFFARIKTGGTSDVASLRKEVRALADDKRNVGLIYLGRAFATAGDKRNASRITAEALTAPGDASIDADIAIEGTKTYLAIGNRPRASEVAQLLVSSIDVRHPRASDVAVILARIEPESALPRCQQVFASSLQYHLLDEKLRRRCELLVELNERSRAGDLLQSCIGALGTMADDWSFANAFSNIAYAAAATGDHAAVGCLEKQVARASDRSTQVKCWPALASALAAEKSFVPAQRLLGRVLELALNAEEDDYDIRTSLDAIADVCVQLNDIHSLQKLTERALHSSKYYQQELLQALLPSLTRSDDKATIEVVLRTFSTDRWAQRSIVLAVGASALLQLGDSGAALTAAREALEAFFKEHDGSVTPRVLRHLIPALVATRLGEGLVQISQMSAEKWPYAHEWGPSVQMLLPALAALGLDEVQPRPYKLFVKESRYVDQVQIDLAELHAKAGLLDKAIAAADQARSPRARAEAHLRIARALAASGDYSRAQERLSAAVSRFPAIRGDELLIAEMASLAASIEASPRVCWTLKQTFLRALDQDVIDVDVGLYRNAARSAAILDDHSILERVKAVPSVSRRPEVRAATSAALMLAFAEASRFEESDRLKDVVHREVDDIGDVTQRSFPLLDLSQALALGGRSEDARKCMILALDCARHAGRPTFIEILSKGARVLLRTASAEEIVAAVTEAGGLWDV